MRKLTFFAVIAMLIMACDSGVDVNPACIMKHTGLVTRLQSSLDTVEIAAANLTWTWMYGISAGDGVIIERSLGSGYDSLDYVAPIESLMIYTDISETLAAEMAVSYRLSLLTGKSVQCFDTVDFSLPAGQRIYAPDTEFVNIPNDTLLISFKRIAGYDTTDLELYRTTYAVPETVLALPISSILDQMTNRVWHETTGDTIFRLSADTLLIDNNSVYVLKVSASKNPILGFITDTSVGLVVFKRY